MKKLGWLAGPLLGLFFVFAYMYVLALSELDWHQCLENLTQSQGEPLSLTELAWPALKEVGVQLKSDWTVPLLWLVWCLPATAILFARRDDLTFRVQTGVLAVLGIAMLVLVLPPSSNHNCDRNGVNFGTSLYPIYVAGIALILSVVCQVAVKASKTRQ